MLQSYNEAVRSLKNWCLFFFLFLKINKNLRFPQQPQIHLANKESLLFNLLKGVSAENRAAKGWEVCVCVGGGVAVYQSIAILPMILSGLAKLRHQ